MKRNWKRLLSSVLALVMVLAMLPVSALADGAQTEAVPSVSTAADSPVQIKKTATVNNGTYTIDMDAYVTGSVQSSGAAPLDIVLVIDQSGSMSNDLSNLRTALNTFVKAISDDAKKNKVDHRVAIVGFAANKDSEAPDYWKNTGLFINGKLKNYETITKTQGGKSYDAVYNISPWDLVNTSYYVRLSNGDYKKIHYASGYEWDRSEGWYYYDGTGLNSQRRYFTPKTGPDDQNSDHMQVYKGQWGGGTETVTPLTSADYQAALVSVNNTSNSVTSSITTAINNLKAEGATYTNYGMEMAKNIFANQDYTTAANSSREKIVVLFTDCYPGTQSNLNKLDSDAANEALGYAYTLKRTDSNGYGATIYTVGLSAKLDNSVAEKLSDFVDQVSSNYPNAQSESNLGTKLPKDKAVYCQVTKDSADLTGIFTSIEESIVANVTVGSDSVLKDTVSTYFAPAGVTVGDGGKVTSGVKVYKVAATGTGDAPTWSTTKTDITSQVTVKLVGKTLSVTGFDYSSDDNLVAKKSDGWHGNKLIVSFNVTPDTTCTSWNGTQAYPTNNTDTSKAGLYYKDADGSDLSTVLSTSPSAVVTTYSVTYKKADNTSMTADVVTSNLITGQSIPDAPTGVTANTGYTLGTWSLSSGTAGADGKIGTTNLEYTLAVTANQYTVKYNLDGGTSTSSTADAQYAMNATVTVAANPTKTGHTFTGWTVTTDPTTVAAPTISSEGKFNMPAANVTLTAQWEAKKYKVTYEYDPEPSVSGAPTLPTEQEKAYGTDVTVEDEPTLPGYTFSGWTTDDATVVSGKFTMPDNDVTFKGSFEPKTGLSYTINYVEKNTTTVIKTSKTVDNQTFGTEIKIFDVEKPEITGFTYDSASTDKLTISTVDTDNVITLYYTRNNYTVEGKIDNGGTITVANSGSNPQTVAYQSSSKAITFTPASGYKITSVKVNDEAVDSFNLDSDGKSYTYPAVEKVTADITVTVTTTALDSVTFTYKAVVGDDFTTTTTNGTVKVNDTDATAGATVTESGNPETWTPKGATAVAEPGYKFVGWYGESAGQGTTPYTQLMGVGETLTFGSSAVLSRPLTGTTYYAKFAPITYTIAFNANGGTGTMDSITGVAYDETKTLTENSFTDTVYTFNGWNTKADGTGANYADKATVKNLTTTDNATVTLYAQWTPSNGTKYTVEHYQQNLNDNGYTLAKTENLTGTTGEKVSATVQSFTGFTYVKGYELEVPSGEIEADGKLVLKLYYDRSTYNVTYDLNGVTGTAPVDSNSYRYGADVTVLDITSEIVAAAEAVGKTFTCWTVGQTAGSGTTAYDPGETIEKIGGDITLYAQWNGIPGLTVEKKLTRVNTKTYDNYTGTVEVGDKLTWTITVTNTGYTTLRNIVVTDQFDGAGDLDAPDFVNGEFVIDSLAPEASKSVTVSYKVLTADAGKPVANTAYAVIQTNGEIDPNAPSDDDTSTVDVKKIEEKVEGEASLYVEKTVSDKNPKVGDTITYTVTVTNDGEVDLWNIRISDDFDGNGKLDFSEKITWLGEGMSKEFTYTYKVVEADRGEKLTNSVTVRGETDGGQTPRDTAKVVVTVDSTLTPANSIIRPSLNARDHVAYIIGYVDGTVRPENDITRSEVAAIFFRLLTDDSRALYWSQYNSYSDVSADAWYNNAVSTLSNAGVITGYTDGTFRPDQPITRAEFATIAARFSDVVYGGTATFPDVPATYWAYKYISLAQYLGWVQGMPDGNFYPEKNITRAEAITMINRVLDRDVEKDHMLGNMVTWTDNTPDKWYYEAVQEATNSHLYSRSYIYATGQDFFTEIWRSITENPDWAALEKAWSTANSK